MASIKCVEFEIEQTIAIDQQKRLIGQQVLNQVNSPANGGILTSMDRVDTGP